jgi:ethanolamine utilization protein EutN
MILARVLGEVWATRKHAALDGRKLLIVAPYAIEGGGRGRDQLVAVDPVGAGVGEDVVVCLGDPARRAAARAFGQPGPVPLPVDAAVMAIVDRVEFGSGDALPSRPLRWLGGQPPVGGAHDAGAELPGGANAVGGPVRR